eukprot:TRINITY_DN2603_c1_g1_i2.p2 TRINITY_DN2603_c1_g1~~TRINITY_DN2603_c1_g1_i2.p2  ORF type:complete len:214 (+),score=68.15 TRINITY_DN2603_c1_g1_i2:795-1436(+)
MMMCDPTRQSIKFENGQQKMTCSGWFLWLTKTMQILAGLAGVALIAANVLLLIATAGLGSYQQFFQILAKVYNVILGVIVVMSEANMDSLFQRMQFMESWSGRGLFQMFVGILMLQGSHQINLSGILGTVVGFVILCTGMLYFIMGVTCLKSYKEKKELQQREADNIDVSSQQKKKDKKREKEEEKARKTKLEKERKAEREKNKFKKGAGSAV